MSAKSKLIQITFSYERLEALEKERDIYQDKHLRLLNEREYSRQAYREFDRIAEKLVGSFPVSSPSDYVDRQKQLETIIELTYHRFGELVEAYTKAKAEGWDGTPVYRDDAMAEHYRDIIRFLQQAIGALLVSKGSVTLQVPESLADGYSLGSVGYHIEKEKA